MPYLEDFFTHGKDKTCCAGPQAREDTTVNHFNEDTVQHAGILYLHGPKHAGQTSLLLQFGFTQAKSGKNVMLLLCGKASAAMSQPNLSFDIVPLSACSICKQPVQNGANNDIWRRINIKYLLTNAELQRFLCSLHELEKQPSVLLIDGFEKFSVNDRFKVIVQDLRGIQNIGIMYQTLAFLLEAQDYMTLTTGSGLAVVTGNTEALVLQNRPLLRRWCRFVELVPVVKEPYVFIMREEVKDETDVDEAVAKTQVKYEFAPETSGTFQLLHVQRWSH